VIQTPRDLLVRRSTHEFSEHTLDYPLVFLLYLASGYLRRWTHGKTASKPIPLFIGLVAYTGLLFGYGVIFLQAFIDPVYLNAITLALAFLLMLGYCWYQRWLVKKDDERERGDHRNRCGWRLSRSDHGCAPSDRKQRR
jgi:hypothetical protein